MQVTNRDATHLSVHPTVVFKLGQDLITDDLQALTELIKNSYDADSRGVDVRIDTQVWTDLAGTEVSGETAAEAGARRRTLQAAIHEIEQELHRDADAAQQPKAKLKSQLKSATEALNALPEYLQGRIEVLDAGTGMSSDNIVRGWLTVSASDKGALKKNGWTSPTFSRTPLGDKGLGRLGVQRLGRVVDLTTRMDSEEPLACTIDWDAFAGAESLRDVEIFIVSGPPDTRVGTRVVVRGLNNLDTWSNVGGLQARLAGMISPYGEHQGFRITLFINGTRMDLREVSKQALDQSAIRYTLRYADGVLKIQGEFSARFLRPDRGVDAQTTWERLIRDDNGDQFLAWLLDDTPKLRELGLSEGDDRYFCRLDTEVRLDNGNAEFVDGSDGELVIADPGPFDARVDVIQRRATRDLFGSKDEYESWMAASQGVRIYRNGFGVRTKADWLNFNRFMTGSSYYSIRPSNVIGYVNITARENAVLEETTNREEFRDLPHYRNFVGLLGAWLSMTELVQEYLGRGFGDYVKFLRPTPEGISTRSTTTEIAADLRNTLTRVQTVAKEVTARSGARERATKAAVDVAEQATQMEEDLFVAPAMSQKMRQLADHVQNALAELDAELQPVLAAAAEVAERGESVNILVSRLEDAQEQVADGWELMSLGITAEVISHEILNLTQRLSGFSRQFAKYNDEQLHDTRVAEYVEHVRSTSHSLHRQASRMDASLRYVRDRRTIVDVAALANRLVNNFEDSSTRTATTLQFAVVEHQGIRIKTSEGKLSQALDNLLLNSLYWVDVAARQNPVGFGGRIIVTVDSPFVTVEDNGPGIDPSIEAVIWDAFTSRKPRGVGRGLGLFVTQQLLQSENISASLDHDRNERGNRFRFRLDFSQPLEGS